MGPQRLCYNKKKLTRHHPCIFNNVSGQNLISPFVPVVTVTLLCGRSFKTFLRYCVAITGLIWGQNNLNLWPPKSNQSPVSPGECLKIPQIMRSPTYIYLYTDANRWKNQRRSGPIRGNMWTRRGQRLTRGHVGGNSSTGGENIAGSQSSKDSRISTERRIKSRVKSKGLPWSRLVWNLG